MMRVRTDFDHFEIESQLGEGGMSRVFLARDISLGRQNAIKILHRQFSSDLTRIRQFEREATITASIHHPNVVNVYSVGKDQGYFYISMELVDGGSLEDRIVDFERIPEEEVLQMGIQIAQGLRAAHNAGLIHRDVKPGNILFGTDGTAKIVDFGLALVHATDKQEKEELWATPYYVPPEKLEMKPEDFRSDIYSLGATLFHALAGRPPFEANTDSVAELKKLKMLPISLADAATAVSAETCTVIDKAMAYSPDDRFASYEEFIERAEYALQCLKRGVAHVAQRTRGKPFPAPRKGERNKKQAKLIAASVAVLSLVGVLLLLKEEKPKPETGVGQGGDISRDSLIASASTLSLTTDGVTVSELFMKGRQALAGGELQPALNAFVSILKSPSVPQPTLDWSRYHAGICLFMEGDAKVAKEFFKSMGKDDIPGDVELQKRFASMRKHIVTDVPIGVQFASDYDADTLDGAVMFAFGLKNWSLGEWGAAQAYIQAFVSGEPVGKAGWLKSFQALAMPYLRDLDFLVDMPKVESLVDYEKGKRSLSVAEQIAGRLEVTGKGSANVEASLRSLRHQVDELKIIDDKKNAEKLKGQAIQELAALRKTLAEMDQFREVKSFAKGVQVLKNQSLETSPGREAVGDMLYLWEGTEAFLDQLVSDLNGGVYRGMIIRSTGAPVSGRVIRADRKGVRVRSGTGEVYVGLEQIPLFALARMAESVMEKVSDSDDYYRRWGLLVAFADTADLRSVAHSSGGGLQREFRPFRERWQRIASFRAGGSP